MSYFKRLETVFIIIVILILGVAYAFLNNKPHPLPNNTDTDDTQASMQQVPSSTVSYHGVDGKNALELLKTNYSVETKSFGDLGEYVQSINGIAPDNTHFWSMYVNGQQSQVGASVYITKSSDTIDWKLEEIK